MSTSKVQAIAGVSPGVSREVMTVYPSVAASPIGRLLGNIYESIPIRIFGVKISHLLFCLPSAPLALIGYFMLKITGVRYTITSQSVQVWRALGNSLIEEVPLASIDKIGLYQDSGQKFYRAHDLVLQSADGKTLTTLEGIPYGDIFRNTIMEARDARMENDAALATIAAR